MNSDLKRKEKGMKKNGVIYSFQCDICQSWFKEKGNLMVHNQLKHTNSEVGQQNRFRCIHCNEYFTQRQLLIHKRREHPRKKKTMIYGYSSYVKRKIPRPEKVKKSEEKEVKIKPETDKKQKRKKILNPVRPKSKGPKRRPPDWFGKNRRIHDKY